MALYSCLYIIYALYGFELRLDHRVRIGWHTQPPMTKWAAANDSQLAWHIHFINASIVLS